MTELVKTELVKTELVETELIDITDQIVPEEDPKFFNDEESLEIYQTCLHLMEEFIKDNPKLISEPDFDQIFDEDINELMHSHFDFDIFYTEEAQDEMEEIIENAKSFIDNTKANSTWSFIIHA